VKDKHRTEPGQILVTLFEGEPYTLWNIRDLARHAGLKVVTSFRFPWACYRGYSHARTLGEIEGKDGARGGWRGEDRDARMYVFEVKTDDNTHSLRNAAGKRKKRPAASDDSDSD
jgi:25S rRNA (uracil2634-N3)-methyltransferase